MTQQSTALKAVEAATPEISNKIYESLALRGDLSGLSPQEKASYYASLCQRLGLDPATQPFIPLKLNGKEILYASKGATDQLARIHNINRQIIGEQELRGAYIVTVEATLPNGRKEQTKGAVALNDLKGEAFCNAIMKAETKAKRRATLSILGLGMLDETEVETIPQAARQPVPQIASHDEAEPIAGEIVGDDPEATREKLVNQVNVLCRSLNNAGDEIKWTKKMLTEYVNDTFNVKDGLDALSFETLPQLIADLEERLRIVHEQQNNIAFENAALADD
jgi:predicted transcriptional regulator